MTWNGVAFVAAVLLASSCAMGADDGSRSAGTGTIAGRVVDFQGQPVGGAEVWGVVYRQRVGKTTTGADGRFRLGPIKEDRPVDVWAEAPGLARQRVEGLHVFGGRDREIGTVTLLPGTRLRGRVVDSKGRPIAGSRIQIEDYRHVLGHTISSDQTEWSITGGAEGRFVTPPLPAGRVYFHFASPGKVRTFVERRAEPGSEKVDMGDIVLVDEVPIRGIVVDQDGKPARGVDVIADYDYEGAAKTDAAGRFEVHGAGEGAKTLLLHSNDYFVPKPFDLGTRHDDLRLVVTKAYEIHGTAVDAETGKPVPIDSVRLCIVERDPDGSFALTG